jgi:hypothetical protein
MAWTASGLYYTTLRDILDTTQLAVNLDLTTNQIAMYNNTETPNYDTETAYVATNEVSGTGYTAGGQDVVNPVFSVTSGTLKFDLDDQVWASISVTAYGAKMYAEALATDNLIVGVNFGGAFTSTAGTFTIQWAAGGVFTIDLTP